MEPIEHNVVVRADAPSHFEEAEVTTIEWQGRPMWSARQTARALGYEDDDRIVTKITTDWSDELAEGTDYVVVRGDDLRALKAAAPGLVDPRAPALTLLTESGVHLVALLSRQPKARALRRWLAEQVLPSIRRTGGYGAGVAARLALYDREIAARHAAIAEHLLARGQRPDDVRVLLSATLPDAPLDADNYPLGVWTDANRLHLALIAPPRDALDDSVAASALRHLVAHLQAHPDRVGDPMKDEPEAGYWWGLWRFDPAARMGRPRVLAVRLSLVKELFERRGLEVGDLLDLWASRGWLSPDYRGSLRRRMTTGGKTQAVFLTFEALASLGYVGPFGGAL